MRKFKELLLLVLILLSVGCSEIDEGFVAGKEYTPAWTQTTMVLVGKVLVPLITQYPEIYRLLIQAEDKTGYCDVDKSTWDKTLKGEWIKCS